MTLPQYPNLGIAMQGPVRLGAKPMAIAIPFATMGNDGRFRPGGVMPIRGKTFVEGSFQYPVQIGRVTLTLLPDGSLATSAGI